MYIRDLHYIYIYIYMLIYRYVMIYVTYIDIYYRKMFFWLTKSNPELLQSQSRSLYAARGALKPEALLGGTGKHLKPSM